MDIIDRLALLTAFGARWILWVLVGLSLAAIAIAVERAVLFFSSRDDVGSLRAELRDLLSRGSRSHALRLLEESPSFEARVAAAGLGTSHVPTAEERMRGESRLVRLVMERNLAFLGTLGNNAPFLGLLGTVIGIVRAFHELSRTTGQVSATLMAEIGEALIATAIGLVVALPAIVSFNIFQRVVRARLSRADVLCGEVIAHLKSSASAAVEE
jgi:biopolymer transport protein ExbB